MSRISALQDNGLDVSASRRLSRDLNPSSPTSPSSKPRPATLTPTSLTSPLHAQSLSLTTSPPILGSTLSSPHTFVSTSSFGPPSPSSSVASSPPPSEPASTVAQASASLSSSSPPPARFPLHMARTETEFATAFPSVDELDSTFKLPPVAKENSGRPLNSAPKPSRGPLPKPPAGSRSHLSTSSSFHDTGESIPASMDENPPSSRPFPSLPNNSSLHQRPASTPIPPISNNMGHTGSSDGGSPARLLRELPQVPSGNASSHLFNPHYVTKTPAKYMNGNHTYATTSVKYDLPIWSSVSPSDLRKYSQKFPAMKILYLDVRTRAEFDVEHIPADEVVCLESHVLMREKCVKPLCTLSFCSL